jgi:prepilin-type N-terminal cleavage/methylation domain-containing protein
MNQPTRTIDERNSKAAPPRLKTFAGRAKNTPASAANERGFTLIETAIALVIMLVMALGAASLFAYSVYNNSGGSDRAQALALAQQALERLRHARFSLGGTDAILAGGVKTPQIVRRGGQNPQDPQDATGRTFRVNTTIDDNPTTSAVDVDALSTLKSITVTVTPIGSGPGWATGSGGAVTIQTLRSKSDTP